MGTPVTRSTTEDRPVLRAALVILFVAAILIVSTFIRSSANKDLAKQSPPPPTPNAVAATVSSASEGAASSRVAESAGTNKHDVGALYRGRGKREEQSGAADATNAVAESMKSIASFSAGDVLEISFQGASELELDGKYIVRAQGYIVLPRLGRVQIAGASYAEIDQVLSDSFSRAFPNAGARPTIHLKKVGATKPPGTAP